MISFPDIQPGDRTAVRIRRILLALTAAVLAFGLLPSANSIHFVPGQSSYGSKNSDEEEAEAQRIISVQGSFESGDKKGTDRIRIPSRINDNDTLTLRSTTQDITAYFGLGFETSGGITTNAEDSEYLSRSTLGAFTESVSLEHPQNSYFKTMSLPELITTYADSDYAILFAVRGDSRDGWSQEMEQAFQSAGFTVTPGDGNENDSWIGYLYQGQAWSDAGTRSTSGYKTIGDTRFYLSSAGIYSGNKAMIRLAGKELAADENGLNVVVYDVSAGKLIDSVSYNTNSADPVMTRADSQFYTEYVTVFRADLLREAAAYNRVFWWMRLVMCIAVAAMLANLWAELRKAEKIMRQGGQVTRGFLIRRQVGLSLIWILFMAATAGVEYLLSNFKGITVDQLIFHMNTNLEGTNWSSFSSLFLTLLLRCGITLAVSLLWYYFMKKKFLKESRAISFRKLLAGLGIRWSAVLCGLIAIFLAADSFWGSYHMADYLAARQFESTLYSDYYVDPKTVDITFPDKPKNLIYIFLESMEISAADETSGGGKSFNAIPELTSLALQNDDFNGEEQTLNGAVPLYNSTWTIGGMVAQSSGLPLGINHNLSNVKGTVSEFMPGADTLGDILSAEGYQNVIMMGSDARFGNRSAYYTEHGNYEIDDYYWAKKNSLLPSSSYKVWWGFEDKKLFSYAEDRASELASGSQPFCLTLLTADTHFYDGYRCEDCPDTFEDQYSNVIACSSKKVAEFVQWVQEQPWGKDTVIVLSGDHLCMDSEYYGDMPSGYERKTYVAVLNSAREEPAEARMYSTMDLFPTTLSALGCTIPGDRLGFGTDLYSSTPTLMEQRGENYLNYELSLNSRFYNTSILGY